MTNLVYQQAAAELRRRISAGVYNETAGLPTEAELCADLEISRSSLRRALQTLRGEGLVASRQGSGWSTVPKKVPVRIGVRTQDDSSGSHITSDLVGHGLTDPPEAVAAVLGSRDGEEILVVERVSQVAGVVVHRSETWFASATSRVVDPLVAAERPPARLLRDLGFNFGRFDQFAEAVLSNDRDEELIGLPPGTAVLQVVRTAYDPSGQVLFQSKHRHPGEKTRIEIDLPTTNDPSGGSVTLMTFDE